MTEQERQHETCPDCDCGDECNCADGQCGCGPDCACHQSKPSSSMLRRIGVGAALVAVPIAVGELYIQLRDAGAKDNLKRERGAAYANEAAAQVIDPSWIGYSELKRIDTGFAVARAIAMDKAGSIWVAGDRAVRKFDAAGARQAEIALDGEPQCLAVADDGVLAVGFKDRVSLYGADGKVTATWKSFGERAYLTCVAVSGSEFYVADAGQRVVYRTDRAGKVLAEFGRENARGEAGLVLPSLHLDVAVGADGLVWVNNPGQHRLEGYRPGGELDRSWGQWSNGVDGFVGCCNPCDFAVLKDGRFVTVEKSVTRVKVYNEHGQLESVVAGPEQFAPTMTSLDVTTDGQGRVLVLEPASRSVRVFAAKEGSRT